MGNLLAIDWDYFFPNPLEGGFSPEQGSALMYDWGHREAPLFIHMLWGSRASVFLANDIPLPSVTEEWREFPKRFDIADDAMLYFADSNMHAGNIVDSYGDPFDEVWLYDAHHDSGYGIGSYKDWLKQHRKDGSIQYSCEDWMLVHYFYGSDLKWRIPQWHESFKERLGHDCDDDCELKGTAHGAAWPEGVNLDAAVDDLEPVEDVQFDTVFVCRSGAWVPPWEDGKFMEFVESFGTDIEQLDDDDLVRKFNHTEAEEHARTLVAAHERAK